MQLNGAPMIPLDTVLDPLQQLYHTSFLLAQSAAVLQAPLPDNRPALFQQRVRNLDDICLALAVEAIRECLARPAFRPVRQAANVFVDWRQTQIPNFQAPQQNELGRLVRIRWIQVADGGDNLRALRRALVRQIAYGAMQGSLHAHALVGGAVQLDDETRGTPFE